MTEHRVAFVDLDRRAFSIDTTVHEGVLYRLQHCRALAEQRATVLQVCAAQFRLYERTHLERALTLPIPQAALAAVKARTNQHFAELCEAALSPDTPTTEEAA